MTVPLTRADPLRRDGGRLLARAALALARSKRLERGTSPEVIAK